MIGLSLVALLSGALVFLWLLATGMRDAFTGPDEGHRGAAAAAIATARDAESP